MACAYVTFCLTARDFQAARKMRNDRKHTDKRNPDVERPEQVENSPPSQPQPRDGNINDDNGDAPRSPPSPRSPTRSARPPASPGRPPRSPTRTPRSPTRAPNSPTRSPRRQGAPTRPPPPPDLNEFDVSESNHAGDRVSAEIPATPSTPTGATIRPTKKMSPKKTKMKKGHLNLDIQSVD